MATKVKQTVTIKKTKTRRTGSKSGYRECNMCHGTGRIKVKK